MNGGIFGNYAKRKGTAEELAVATAFMNAGAETIFFPFSDDSPIDLIVLKKKKLLRIQVKTSRIRNDKIIFKTKPHRDEYKGNIDYFATMCKNKCYVVPYKYCTTSARKLLMRKEFENQIMFFENYELTPKMLEKMGQ